MSIKKPENKKHFKSWVAVSKKHFKSGAAVDNHIINKKPMWIYLNRIRGWSVYGNHILIQKKPMLI